MLEKSGNYFTKYMVRSRGWVN